MTTQEAVQQIEAQPATPPEELDRLATWINSNTGFAFQFNALTGWQRYPAADRRTDSTPCGSYSTLKPADAVQHLNELLSAEIERFEHDTSLRLAAVKVLRDRKAGDIFVKVQAHVR